MAFIVLKVFVLLDCTFPSLLARESRLFLELVLSTLVGISGLLTSPATNLENSGQKGKPENSLLCCSLGPEVPSLPSSLPF